GLRYRQDSAGLHLQRPLPTAQRRHLPRGETGLAERRGTALSLPSDARRAGGAAGSGIRKDGRPAMIEIKLTSLESGTAAEYRYLEELDETLNAGNLPRDVLALFAGTDRATGYPISPMQHALQTATRAFREGAGEETIFAALFHDIADRIAPINHSRVGAEILRPYIGEETHWVLAHHSI